MHDGNSPHDVGLAVWEENLHLTVVNDVHFSTCDGKTQEDMTEEDEVEEVCVVIGMMAPTKLMFPEHIPLVYVFFSGGWGGSASHSRSLLLCYKGFCCLVTRKLTKLQRSKVLIMYDKMHYVHKAWDLLHIPYVIIRHFLVSCLPLELQIVKTPG